MPRESLTPVASVAHEGNPRTNTLTVSGTLDGDIFLIPIFPPPDAVSGDPPPDDIVRPLPPNPEVADSVFASNSGKYILTDFKIGTDGQNTFGPTEPFEPNDSNNAIEGTDTFVDTSGTIIEYSKRNDNLMFGMIKSSRIACNQRFIDNSNPTPGLSHLERSVDHFNLDFFELFHLLEEQSAVQAGDRWGELPGNSAVTNVLIEATAYASTLAVGKPFCGVAVGVPPTATHHNFSGIVGAYNWGNQTQYLLRYRNQPLSELGEVLGSFVTTDYLVNDGITCQIRKRRSTGLWTASTFGVTVSNLTDSDIPYFEPDMRIAIVNLPSTVDSGVVDDFMTWKEVSGLTWAD